MNNTTNPSAAGSIPFLEQNLDRRDALKTIGCLFCAALVPSIVGVSTASAASAITPFQVVKAGELSAAGNYKLGNVNNAPALIYASDKSVPNGVQWGKVWLVALSRNCTHEAGKLIQEPKNGDMVCSEHPQHFDPRTGVPSTAQSFARKALTQYSLELRQGNVWLTGIARA
jgi:Rieske Fe-S protein